MSWLEHFRGALDQLRAHKLRTFLTLLGMIFGVGAVIAMLAVGEGARREALQMIEGMGLRNLLVTERAADGESLREIREHSVGLSLRDIEAALDTLPFVDAWSAQKEVRPWELFSAEGSSDARVLGVTPSHFDLAHLQVTEGRPLSEQDDLRFAAVAVLGSGAARTLFPNGNALGSRIKVNHQWLEVIGLLQDRQTSQREFQGLSVGGESDHIYIPLNTALRRFAFPQLASELDGFRLRLGEQVDPGTGAEPLNYLLERRHGGERDFEVVVPARLLAQHQQTQRIFTIVMSCVAGISLLVGGIGIMNIMLATVLERRSEIGLLRAVGARRRDIIRQFLVETTTIALLGAALGIVTGFGLALIIGAFAGWAVAWSPMVILLAVAVCVLIAVSFGVYPAVQASRLDPVLALQSD